MDNTVVNLEEKKQEPVQEHNSMNDSVNNDSQIIKMECDNDLKNEIIQKHLYPNYVNLIAAGLQDMRYWQYTATAFCTIASIMMSVSTILSFSAPQFTHVNFVSYLAGCFGVVAICCDRFSHYCDSKSSFSTKKVNMLLKSLGIKYKMPDISMLSVGDNSNNNNNNNIQTGIAKN
jgi:hypothetical protein